MLDDKQLSIVYSNAPTLIKLGFLSVNRQHIPKWCALISFLICNFQTIELLLNNANLYLTSVSSKGSTLIEAYLHLFSFSHRFSYTNCVSIFIWGGIMLAYCLHFLILFLYLSIKLKKKSVIPGYIQKYWSIINYFHPLIFFFPIHAFNLQVIQANRLDTFTKPLNTPVMIIFYMNIILNFWLAFSSTRFFHVVIKTKDLLSSKGNSIRTNDVLSKTLISILWMFADDHEFMPAFTLVIAAIDCCFRDFTLFYYLPYYSTQILEISALMQGANTCLSLLTLLAKALEKTNLHLGQYFIHVAWVIMIPLGAKLYLTFLRRLFEYITSADEGKINLHYALHQVILLKNLAKKRLAPNSETRIFNLPYLIFQAIAEEGEDDKSIRGDRPQILKTTRMYYIGVTAKNPHSHIAKVALAHHYVKKENAYLLANNLIEEVLNDSPSFSVLVSLSLIRFELQKKTFLEYSQKGENQAESLNLLHYVQVNRLSDHLKKKIKHQIRKQLEFWENFASTKPDMGLLTQLALDVEFKKEAVEKAWKELAKSRPSTFYSPPLVFGMYVSLANNNTIEGEKIMSQYHTDILKTSRLMDVDELNNNTMMAEDTVQISMSGSRTKIGYILDCSANISEIYGWKKEFLVKQPIITIMPPYYQHKHDRFLMNHYNTGKTKLLNNTSVLPVVGSDGYIKPSRVHIKMHPFVEQGIYYIAVLRELKEPRRMVLIRKDGTIDGMSKNFADDMNIKSKDQLKSLTIFNLCPEFRSVNSVFNAKAAKVIDASSKAEGRSSSKGNLTGEKAHKDADTELGGFLSDNGLLSNHEDSSKNIFSSTRNLRSTSEKLPANCIGIDAKIQNIYDSFTAGSKLTFYPPQTTSPIRNNKLKFFARSKPINDPSNSVQYNVQIITRIHGKEFIKVVYLDRIITEDNESSNDLPSEHRRQRSSRTPTPVSRDQSPSAAKFNMNVALVSSNRALLSPSATFGESKIQGQAQDSSHKIDVLNETGSEMGTSRGMTIPEESAHSEMFDQNMSTLRQNFVKRGLTLEKKESNKAIALKKRRTLAAGELTEMKLLGMEKPRLAKIIGQFIQATRKGEKIFEAKSQSVSEEQKSQPLQAENLLRKKLRKLRKRLDNKGVIEVEREGSVAASSFSRGKKVQGLILKALDLRTYSKSTILFCTGFFLFNLIVLALQTWESLNILSAVNNITTKTDVVENGVFRLDSFLNLGLYARIWYESLDAQNMNSSLTNQVLAYELQVYTNDASEYNTLLIEQVTQIDSKYQSDFYEQDIRMYENGTLIGSYSNFAASNLMINHAIKVISEHEASNYTNTDLSDLEFIVDNIYDDFLVSCEETISLLMADLNSILSDTDVETLVLFCLILAVNVIFLFIVLKYFHSVHKESNRFSNLLFRLNLKEAQEVKSILQNFLHSLDANVHDIGDMNEKQEILETVKSEASTGKVKFRRASTSNLLKRQIFMFLRLLPIFIVVIAWTLSYFIITKNILTKIQEQQAQIEYSLMILYRQNLVIAEFIELLSTDSTATVRNRPIHQSLLNDLSNLQDVGNIISQFMDTQGNLKPDEYKVFFDFACTDFVYYDLQLTDALVSNCLLLSDGTGKTSFSKITTLMHSAIMDYYNQLMGDSWTEDQLDEAYEESLSDFMSLALVAPALCKILYLTNAIDFYVQIDNAKSSATIFSVVTIVGIAASAIVVWFFVIKKILRLETYYKLILKLVPVPSILNNQHLKTYLIQNSNHILDNVKSFL